MGRGCGNPPRGSACGRARVRGESRGLAPSWLSRTPHRRLQRTAREWVLVTESERITRGMG
jgi:hypothetical protein